MIALQTYEKRFEEPYFLPLRYQTFDYITMHFHAILLDFSSQHPLKHLQLPGGRSWMNFLLMVPLQPTAPFSETIDLVVPPLLVRASSLK